MRGTSPATNGRTGTPNLSIGASPDAPPPSGASPSPSAVTSPVPVSTTSRPPSSARPPRVGAPSGARSKTAHALLPANPKLLVSATRPANGRPASRTQSRSHPSRFPANPAVGGRKPARPASRVDAASSAPAAPRQCPIIDFVELTGTAAARSPRRRCIARVSAGSFARVPVPCALT
jgi:hypothetical protein